MNKKNLKIIYDFILILTLFISAKGFSAYLTTTVWSDNFDDGNYDDWTVLAGSVSASTNVLRVTSSGYAVIYRNSTTVTGTWRFDLDMTDNPDDVQICFITKNIDGVYVRDNYLVENNADDDGFRFVRWIWTGSSMSPLILDEYDVTGGLTGWYHFDITRDGSGRMFVYINDTLVMQAVDTTHSTASCFVFNVPIAPSGTGPAIDNVIVSDTVDITQPTTDPTSSSSSSSTTLGTTKPASATPMIFSILIIGIMTIITGLKRKKQL